MNRNKTLKTVFSYLRPYAVYVIISLLLALITVALTLYVPILTGQAVDEILGAGNVNFSQIFRIIWLIGLAVAITSVAQWFMSVCNNRLTYGMVRDIRRDAFAKILKLPLKYLDKHPSGDLVSRVITDV
ncbi:MAG: ABC transporter ATP-binding protein, partial [Clostridia bacterium]|nr:ABC transporter ATP-binding protein [Clostridia bacterium]